MRNRAFAPLLIMLLFCLVHCLPTLAQREPPALSQIRENFAGAYQCLQERGLATFSVRVSSDQMRDICRTLKIDPPELWFDFRSPASFSLRPPSFDGVATAQRQLIADLHDVIKNSIEGFFQAWEPVAYTNLIPTGSCSARLNGDNLILEYVEVEPHQTVTLTFDRDFRLETMEARDAERKLASLVKMSWEKQGGRWILRTIQSEFRSQGTMTFMTRMAIENIAVGSYYLPARVLIQALDGESGRPTQATFEIRLDEYRF
ncbi:MAG TPA: hypothetical protein PKO06_12480 [Candidatus Ozemobacteraceae bacterium]|nr:hypothetical protein [Candidatus Ozemobacteraceae bacterium]